MHKPTKTRLARGLFLDRDIQRLRDQLERLNPFLAKRAASASLADFDQGAEVLISEVFGETSAQLEAYEYAKLGEAASLVNLPEEAQEGGVQNRERESLQQRKRVLEACITELETRRAAAARRPSGPKLMSVPRVAEYMSGNVRSIAADASLKEAGRLLQKLKVGSLLVDDNRRYIGIITERDLSRKAIAKGLDPSTTPVKACMSRPIITIEDTEPLTEAVRLMRNNGIRHLAVTEDRTIIGILSISDLLRYYSGIW